MLHKLQTRLSSNSYPTMCQEKMFSNYVIILLCNLISSIFARLINLWNPVLQLYWNQSWYFCWLSKPVVGASQSQIFFHCIIWFCMLNIITSYHGNAFCIIGPCMIPLTNTETKMLSFWRNFHHWVHRKLSKWQLPVQPLMKISSK